MVIFYLDNGDCVEIDDAVRVEAKEGALVCIDKTGLEVARFHLEDVKVYSSDPELIQIIRDEVCDDEPAPQSNGSASQPA